MPASKKQFENVADYIAASRKDVQRKLRQLRQLIRTAAPAAQESISYHIPAYKLDGRALIFFAAYKNHIGIYPMLGAIRAFKKGLAGYPAEKATIRFPLDKPLPLPLLRKIVKFRIREISK